MFAQVRLLKFTQRRVFLRRVMEQNERTKNAIIALNANAHIQFHIRRVSRFKDLAHMFVSDETPLIRAYKER